MVKPTIGICCEFAQKHGAEFVQIFFEKLLDNFARRVYNDIVPERTGAKKNSVATNATEGGFMNITKKIYKGAGRTQMVSALTGKTVPVGTEYALIEATTGAMCRCTIPVAELNTVKRCKSFARTRGGVKPFTPGDGRGRKHPVEVRLNIPAGNENRVETKALLCTAGFRFESRGFNTKTVLDCGSWTAWMQAHAGEMDVEIYVRDRKTGLEYCCNLATVDPKSDERVALQRAHGTNTDTAKRRGNSKPTK